MYRSHGIKLYNVEGKRERQETRDSRAHSMQKQDQMGWGFEIACLPAKARGVFILVSLRVRHNVC